MLRILAFLFMLLLLILTGGYVALVKPYLTRELLRTSDRPQELLVEYVAETCDPYAPRLFELAKKEGTAEPSRAEKGVTLALPSDLSSPEDTDWAFPGNRFVLTGYRYRQVIRNRITGQTEARPASRIDLVAWRSLIPAKRWEKSPDGSSPQPISLDQPVVHQTQAGEPAQAASQFQPRKYNDCL